MADLDRLRKLLGGADTAWLLDRMRRRLANGKPLSGIVTLASPTHDQRRAAERLLGRRAGTGTSLTVSLDELDAVLRRSGAALDGLIGAASLLIGDVPDRMAQETAWSAAHQPLDELVAKRPVLAAWRTWLNATGMLRRLTTDVEKAPALVISLVRVLAELPSDGVALGRLAARATGDAHALDDGRPLATLVLAAARVLAGSSPTGDGSASGRRASWAAVGVHRDELSSSVLCLNLPGGTSTLTGRMLTLAREGGEPCVLTLRQLGQVDLGVGNGLVWACENPIVLASAADELGPACPPLVCLNGQPSTAVWRLLNLLVADGAQLRYHGDFDWGGLRIGNTLCERIPWRPWRFDTSTYQTTEVAGSSLIGKPVVATWDPSLSTALQQRGVRIEEELVLADLLYDLRAHTS
ncbi:TIGR02679 family protein [Amycolatopsis sp. cg5]|uniref:TIGR02679 family protein n=1 Tax=Amycolatopsis sp. cg5 TaxID=3238802 RepID=UPI00352503BE